MPIAREKLRRLPVLMACGLLLTVMLPGTPGYAAAERRNGFVYEPPEKAPKGSRSHYVESPADWLLDHMAAHLRELGLSVEYRDASKRTLVARYTGDPREFVDCGLVQMVVDGKRPKPPKQYSANRPETRTYRLYQGRRVGLLREMQLDARVAVEIEPEGKGSRVKSDAVYVLTKTVSRIYKGGDAGQVLDREVISFDSSEIGRFKKGTSCVSTGKLEDLPVLPFKKSTS